MSFGKREQLRYKKKEMDETSISVLVLISATVVLLTSCIYRKIRRGRCRTFTFPPGNIGFPVIGETISFMKLRPSVGLEEFMQSHIPKFGKIFSANLFGQRMIVSADPELNRLVMRNDMRLFETSWPRSFNIVLGKLSISKLVGDAHKHMRSIMLELLSTERLRSVFLEDAEQLASMLLSSPEGSVICAADVASKFSFYIMGKEILSMDPGGSEMEQLRNMYEGFTSGITSLPVNIPGTTYWKALQSKARVLKIFKKKMEERTLKSSDGNLMVEKDDYLGLVLKNTNYSQEQIGDLLVHTFFAGHATTARAISLMIYFLEGCPKAIEQLREEHLQVVSSKKNQADAKLSWDDYKSMEFTQSVIFETLRLGNVVGYSLKKAAVDVHYKGYLIPQGCTIMAHFRAVHFDSSLFSDPISFNPWRWLRQSGITRAKDMMAFGGGPRFCLGAELARLEMVVFLHHLISRYDWEFTEADHPVSSPTINFIKGLPIKLHAVSSNIQAMDKDLQQQI